MEYRLEMLGDGTVEVELCTAGVSQRCESRVRGRVRGCYDRDQFYVYYLDPGDVRVSCQWGYCARTQFKQGPT